MVTSKKKPLTRLLNELDWGWGIQAIGPICYTDLVNLLTTEHIYNLFEELNGYILFV